MKEVLYIAAKAPRVGAAKTRLARSIGPEAAAELYGAFLKDLWERFAQAPFEVGWYLTPAEGWTEVSALLDGRVPEGRMPLLFQGEGDWTDRQIRFFSGAADRGEERVILIASDSPQLTMETVSRAFRQLDRQDLVFGPVHDGGYYLIGMRAGSGHEALKGIPMSTDTVLEEITARAHGLGLSVGWVEPTFDIDEAEDLARLRQVVRERPDLGHTRTVLEKYGLV